MRSVAGTVTSPAPWSWSKTAGMRAALSPAARNSSSLPTNPAAGGRPGDAHRSQSERGGDERAADLRGQEQQRVVQRVDDRVEDGGAEADRSPTIATRT
jgi:hypothetical protein